MDDRQIIETFTHIRDEMNQLRRELQYLDHDVNERIIRAGSRISGMCMQLLLITNRMQKEVSVFSLLPKQANHLDSTRGARNADCTEHALEFL
jgi:hypothetical protein